MQIIPQSVLEEYSANIFMLTMKMRQEHDKIKGPYLSFLSMKLMFELKEFAKHIILQA